jgi:hypothetical protein
MWQKNKNRNQFYFKFNITILYFYFITSIYLSFAELTCFNRKKYLVKFSAQINETIKNAIESDK